MADRLIWETVRLEWRGMADGLGLRLVYALHDAEGRRREIHEVTEQNPRAVLRVPSVDGRGGYWVSYCPVPIHMLKRSMAVPPEWTKWLAENPPRDPDAPVYGRPPA